MRGKDHCLTRTGKNFKLGEKTKVEKLIQIDFDVRSILASVSVTLAKPDLIISKVEITKDKDSLYLAKIIVTAKNHCRESIADAFYILITFKEDSEPNARAIYFVGSTVKALKGGESQTQTFEILGKKIGFGRYVYIEADPYKKGFLSKRGE